MNILHNTSGLISLLCGILEINAYGTGDVSLLITGGSRKTPLLDGSCVMTARAVVTAAGFKSREELLQKLDRVSEKAALHRSGEGIMKISALSPAVMKACSEKGYLRFEQEYEVTYMGGHYNGNE